MSEDDMRKLWDSFYRNRKTNGDSSGPVIGVTGEVYDLKGIVVCAVGALIQLFFLCPHIVTAFSHIYYLCGADFESSVVWDDTGKWMMLIWINLNVGSAQMYSYFAAQIGRSAIPVALVVTFYRVWKQYNGKIRD